MAIKQKNLENKGQKISLIIVGVLIATLWGKIDRIYCLSAKEEPIEQADLQETSNNKQEVVQEEEDKKEKNAHISAFGITLKKTTKSEIKRKFSVVRTDHLHGFPGHERMELEPKDFSLGYVNVKCVEIWIDPQGKVEEINLEFFGEVFDVLEPLLSKKYPLIKKYPNIRKKDSTVVGLCAEYETKYDEVSMYESHIGGETYLSYSTKEFTNFRHAQIQKDEEQRQREMEGKL